MIAYFDASAFLKLVIDEPGSEEALETWRTAQSRVSSQLLYPEARAGLARARRMNRLDDARASTARRRIEAYLDEAEFVGVTVELAQRAGHLAELHGLGAYDAVHLASAEVVAEESTVLVAADGELLEAAREHGLSTLAVAR